MTQGKKKKRAANRSIMLAKKIIIKDGGTVSLGSAPQGGPGAGPARSSPCFRLRRPGAPSPPALSALPPSPPAASAAWLLGTPPAPAAGRGVSGACGLGPRAPAAGGGVGPSVALPGPARRAGRPGSPALHMLWRVAAAAAARWARVRASSRRSRREPERRL